MRVATPFAEIVLPKLVIDELTARASVSRFAASVGGFSALLVILNFLVSYTDDKIEGSFGYIASVAYFNALLIKHMTMDYELQENPDVKKLDDKAMLAANGNNTRACNYLRTVSVLLVNILGFVLYASLIASIHPVIILLLTVSAALNWLMLRAYRKYEEKTQEERAKIDRKLRYIAEKLQDSGMASSSVFSAIITMRVM